MSCNWEMNRIHNLFVKSQFLLYQTSTSYRSYLLLFASSSLPSWLKCPWNWVVLPSLMSKCILHLPILLLIICLGSINLKTLWRYSWKTHFHGSSKCFHCLAKTFWSHSIFNYKSKQLKFQVRVIWFCSLYAQICDFRIKDSFFFLCLSNLF